MKKIFSIAIPSIVIMALVDGLINPGYFSKSLIRIFLFFVLPYALYYAKKEINVFKYLKAKDKKSLLLSFSLGLGVYAIIMASYLILSQFIDLAWIREVLSNDFGVGRENFIFVAIYISFINSLLEEFFFRGFLFLELIGKTTKINAYIISAGFFSIYHIAIIGNMFQTYIFALAMLGLFIGGILFSILNQKNKTILNSWLVHMMANFAINHVGLILFDIV